MLDNGNHRCRCYSTSTLSLVSHSLIFMRYPRRLRPVISHRFWHIFRKIFVYANPANHTALPQCHITHKWVITVQSFIIVGSPFSWPFYYWCFLLHNGNWVHRLSIFVNIWRLQTYILGPYWFLFLNIWDCLLQIVLVYTCWILRFGHSIIAWRIENFRKEFISNCCSCGSWLFTFQWWMVLLLLGQYIFGLFLCSESLITLTVFFIVPIIFSCWSDRSVGTSSFPFCQTCIQQES